LKCRMRTTATAKEVRNARTAHTGGNIFRREPLILVHWFFTSLHLTSLHLRGRNFCGFRGRWNWVDVVFSSWRVRGGGKVRNRRRSHEMGHGSGVGQEALREIGLGKRSSVKPLDGCGVRSSGDGERDPFPPGTLSPAQRNGKVAEAHEGTLRGVGRLWSSEFVRWRR
jgi:hypothetical protein